MTASPDILHALILEDSGDDARMTVLALERHGFIVQWQRAETEQEMITALEARTPAVVLADHGMPKLDPGRALDILHTYSPGVPVILVSGTIGEETMVDLLRVGARDFVAKTHLERLGGSVERVLNETRIERERKDAERALRESERRYRCLVTATSDFLWWADTDGAVYEIDPAWLVYTDYDQQQALGWGSFSAIHPDDRDPYLRAWREAIRSGEVFRKEYRLQHRDGGCGWFLDRAAPVFDDESGIIEWVGTSSDISRRKETEEALRVSEARYRKLFEDSPNGILVMDDLQVVDCNTRAPEIFGRSRTDLIGVSVETFSPEYQPKGEKSADLAWRLTEAARHEEAQEFEWTIRRGDGGAAVVEVLLAAVDHYLHAIVRDVTERRALERREREHHAMLQGLSEGTTDFVFVKDTAGRYVHINTAAAGILDRTVEEVLGRTDADLLPPEAAERSMAYDRAILASARPRTFDEQFDLGIPRILQTTKGVCRDPTGEILGVFGISRDVTTQRTIEAEMRKLSRAVQQAADAIIITDADRVIEYVNPAFERVTGYPANEVIGRTPSFLGSEHNDPGVSERLRDDIRAGREFHGMLVNRRRSGELYYADMSIAPIRDDNGRICHFIGSQYDITEQLRTERELARLAHYDPVTELPNRTLTLDRINHMLSQVPHVGGQILVMHVDLDGFGLVNESWGQSGGDHVLARVAEMLTRAAGPAAAVGRIGNDGFVVAVMLASPGEPPDETATRIQHALREPIAFDTSELRMTGTIGIALGPDDGEAAEPLMAHAEMAMQRARERGREQIALYTATMYDEARHSLSLEGDLRRALEQGEFHLEYQPQVDLESGRISGLEALLRWTHPARGPVSPGEFIPLLERSGLIVAVGEWVIREACTQIREWQPELGGDGGEGIRVAVNLSLVQFERRDLVEVVREALYASGTEARFLELELTETSLAHNPDEANRTLHALRELGVTVALDDFGIGYSSLNYLKQFPIDSVKIDRVFIDGMTRDPGDAAILRAVLALAGGRGMKTVAEGVETDGQVRFLRAEGCRHVQGFLFSPAAPAQDIRRMLATSHRFDVSGGDSGQQPVIIACTRDTETRDRIHTALGHAGYRIVDVDGTNAALQALALHARIVVVLADARDGMPATELLRHVRDLSPDIRRALIMPEPGGETLRHAVNTAAVDRLLSIPVDGDELQREIGSLMEDYELRVTRTSSTPA